MSFWGSKETPEEYEARRQRNAERAQEREEREKEREYNRHMVTMLTNSANNIYNSIEYYSKENSDEMRSLQAEIKNYSNVGRDYKHMLDGFWTIVRDFRDKQSRHFEERKRKKAEDLSTMSDLVSQVEMIALSPGNFKESHEIIVEITNKMKTLRCERQESDLLWSKLKSAKDIFYKKRSEFYEAKKMQWGAAAEIARDSYGNKIGEYKVGTSGYIQETKNNFGRGHTTGHAAGDLHHHDTHSKGRGSSHFSRSSTPPGGRIIGSIVGDTKK